MVVELKGALVKQNEMATPAQDIQTDVTDRVLAVISTSKTELRVMRYELNDYEWRVIKGVYS